MTLPMRTDQHTLDAATVANVLLTGDLEKLNDQQRMAYCHRVCETLGLNPITQPFAFIRLSGRLVMYAKKDATEQLRKLHGVSITEVTSQNVGDVFVVTAKAQDKTGRTDAATGAVAIGNLKGESLANALMKAETKAKRRVTLSICGLGMLDETEVESGSTFTAEAPKRITLPPGTVQILRVEKQLRGNVSWADVTYVDEHGVENTLPTAADPKDAAVALYTQLAESACPVTLTTKVTPRNKKTVIDTVMRFIPADQQKPEEPTTPVVAEKDLAF